MAIAKFVQLCRWSDGGWRAVMVSPRTMGVLLMAVSVAAASVVLRGQSVPAAAKPNLFDPTERSIEEIQRAMAAGEVTSRQLVDAYLARIGEYDQRGPALNAIKAVNPAAGETADALDAERARSGPRGPLHGIPILVKDNYETIEMPTTAGSIALATFHPRQDAVLVQRLKTAGAVILGKTNMHELAAGITSVGSGFGQVRNPYDPGRNAGGSSGGTGAAVAASFAAAGMGSDTCGSIRYPSSQNNLVGLRGTQGLSSRTGIVPLSSTQDIGGPIARTITDLAIVLDATVGPDPSDASTSMSAGRFPASYREILRRDALKGARIGVVRSLFIATTEDQEVATIVQKALDALKTAGAEVIDVPIPGLDELLRDSSMISHDFKFDFAEYLARFDDAPVKSLGEILDRGLLHAMLEPTFRARNAVVSRESEQSRRARIKRTALRQAIEAALDEHSVAALVYPTLRRKPARLGDPQGPGNCLVSAVSGLPALSVPAGFTDDRLPVGMDLLSGAFTEEALLSLGFGIEQALNSRHQPFSTPPLTHGRRPATQTRSLTLRPSGRSGPAADGDGLTVTFSYDAEVARMDYALRMDPALARRVDAVWIHGGTVERPGAARHQIHGQDRAMSGTVAVSAADRADLAAGGLVVRLYLRDMSGSAADAALSF